MQAPQLPASSLHWNVDPASVDVNEKEAVLALVGFAGIAVIAVSGGVVSGAAIVENDQVRSEAIGLPATSVTPPAPPLTVTV